MTVRTLDEAFDSFTRSAWRLEARDFYQVGDRFEQWLRDGLAPGPSPEWNEVIKDAAARGARVGRVRLVGRPITDYTRWEFLAYRHNAEAGEDIQVVDREWLTGETWDSVPDFWLFDDSLAFVQHYADDGTYQGAEQVDAAPFVVVRRHLEQLAVPLAAYQFPAVPGQRQPASAPTTAATG